MDPIAPGRNAGLGWYRTTRASASESSSSCLLETKDVDCPLLPKPKSLPFWSERQATSWQGVPFRMWTGRARCVCVRLYMICIYIYIYIYIYINMYTQYRLYYIHAYKVCVRTQPYGKLSKRHKKLHCESSAIDKLDFFVDGSSMSKDALRHKEALPRPWGSWKQLHFWSSDANAESAREVPSQNLAVSAKT